VRVWRLGPDGVSHSIDFNKPDAAAAGGRCVRGCGGGGGVCECVCVCACVCVRACVDLPLPHAAATSTFTGMQMEGGGKISAVTCNPGVRGCMALTTPVRFR